MSPAPGRVGLVMVGDELLDGRTRESNSHYLIDRLSRAGAAVGSIRVVNDDIARIVAALDAAVAESAAVVVTGGLGPTRDDLTREALAAFVDEELEFDEALAAALAERYRRRGREMASSNLRQAWRPPGTRPFSNPRGTAPGLLQLVDGVPVVLLPGVPAELRAMWEETAEGIVLPVSRGSARPFVRLRTARMAESDLADRVIALGLHDRGDLDVAYCVTRFGVDLLLYAQNEELPLQSIAERLRAQLSPHVYGVGAAGLDEVVSQALRARGESLAVAESCTGGLLGACLTGLAGSSDIFRGGILAYADASKSSQLDVDPALIAEHGAVSDAVARAMARGARRRLDSSWALSVTGIAGPDGGTADKPVGTVWVGLAGPHGDSSELSRFPGDREQNRIWSVSAALDLLRRELLS